MKRFFFFLALGNRSMRDCLMTSHYLTGIHRLKIKHASVLVLVETPCCEDTLWKWKATNSCECTPRSWQRYKVWSVSECVLANRAWSMGVWGVLDTFHTTCKTCLSCLNMFLPLRLLDGDLFTVVNAETIWTPCCLYSTCFVMLLGNRNLCWIFSKMQSSIYYQVTCAQTRVT